MDKYQIISSLSVGAGVRLGLSKEQAACRAHVLKDEGKGVYMTLAAVQFKAGESVSIDGALPKPMASLVEKTKPAKKAEAE